MAKVFISYASPDGDVASRIVRFLEENAIPCWVAPRDLPPGVEYGAAIVNAIGESCALVLVLSEHSNESQFVRNEVERAVSKSKPVLPVRIREVTPSGALEFFVSSAQWVDAWESPVEEHLLPLVAAIGAMGQKSPARARLAAPRPPRRKFRALAFATMVVVAVAVAAGAWWLARKTEVPVAPVAIRMPAPAPSPVVPVATDTTPRPDAALAPSVVTKPPARPPVAPKHAPVRIAKTPAVTSAAPPKPETPVAPAKEETPVVPHQGDIDFVLGSWCQRYTTTGEIFRYNRVRKGDVVVTHSYNSEWGHQQQRDKVIPIKGGFEFRPVDGFKNTRVVRYKIIDASTLRLVFPEDWAQQDIELTRCPPAK
jgi:hypothetical protein